MNDPINIPVVITRGGVTGDALVEGARLFVTLSDNHIRQIHQRMEVLFGIPAVPPSTIPPFIKNLFGIPATKRTYGGSFGGPTYVDHGNGRLEIHTPPAVSFTAKIGNAEATSIASPTLPEVAAPASDPPCQECEGTGTVNTFEPSPTSRGETGDMENWPGPCPKCATDASSYEAQRFKEVDSKRRNERTRLRALVLRILGHLSQDLEIVIPVELPDNFEETVMAYIVGHDENRDKAQVEGEKLRQSLAEANREIKRLREGSAALVKGVYAIRDALGIPVGVLGPNTAEVVQAVKLLKENAKRDEETFRQINEVLDQRGIIVEDTYAEAIATAIDGLRTDLVRSYETVRRELDGEVRRLTAQNDKIACEYEKEHKELCEALEKVKELGIELDKQGQAHHKARERFVVEIKAAYVARAAAAQGYRDAIKEIAADRDTARAAHAEAMLKLKDVTKWAEGLIRQLPAGHNGRDSWLLNYGTGYDVEELRDKHPTYRAKHQNKDASK